MGLLWPWYLLLLGLIPLVAVVYIWILRRRRRYALRFSSLTLVREALPERSNWHRHLPAALFLLALASLVVALGRPFATVTIPIGQTSVLLAMDVSRSMCSTDIRPNRLEAAKDAARSYIERQTAGVQIGIVAFAGFAETVQPPTDDEELLQDAISGLTTGRRTAIGSAILEALEAIREVNGAPSPQESLPEGQGGEQPESEDRYRPDIIVLLTDGASNSGPLPLQAAQEAVKEGIRIYTIGFGTAMGGTMDCGDGLWGGGWGGGFGGFGGGFRRGIDELTLQQIAEMTGGEYYSAESADELHKVFQNLPTYLITKTERMEISIAFTALGAALAALAILLSLLWHPLP